MNGRDKKLGCQVSAMPWELTIIADSPAGHRPLGHRDAVREHLARRQVLAGRVSVCLCCTANEAIPRID
jgi:hypothetical protein